MSMATPFEPEPAHDQQDEAPVVPEDDVLTDATTADGAPVDETVPDDETLAEPEVRDDADEDALDDALHSDEPQGYRAPEPGRGLTADELRGDLGE